jgi:PHD/YefM family antitoxin component YafN of YafNO toxin-antitoxin module
MNKQQLIEVIQELPDRMVLELENYVSYLQWCEESETSNLLESPANAERLLESLQRARLGVNPVQSVTSLREEMGLDTE